MVLEEIKKFQGERKWLQFCDCIADACSAVPRDELLKLYTASIPNIHPKSLTKATLLIIEGLPADRAIEILELTQNAIKDSIVYGGFFDKELMRLEIAKLLLLVERGELNGVEKRIYEWKGLEMDAVMKSTYHLLGFNFYTKLGDPDSAFDHLFIYAKHSPETNVMDKLLKHALLSKRFYDFNSIAALPRFESCKDRELKKIFLLSKNGDVSGLSKCGNTLSKIFGAHAEIVRQKVYIIALLNICFSAPEKMVPLDRITSDLEISEEMCGYIVLRSFGLGLIDGWIDGENKVLYFNGTVPRVLNAEEIKQMAGQFENWKNKVRDVVRRL
jgi:26S proteasome regulatory subunit N9